ncbi:hypothetical protein ACQ4PT_019808 [Festuca glaucescens]
MIKQCFIKCPTFPENAVIRRSGIPNSTKNGKMCISVELYVNAFGFNSNWLVDKNWLLDQLSMSVQEVMSVLEINSTDGLSDPKLGATVNHKREARCATCDAGAADCPGHFGHLVLAKPILHIGFMQTVLAVLRCVCISCSRLLANEGIVTKALRIRNSKDRLKYMSEACKRHTECLEDDCPETQNKKDVDSTKIKSGCGHVQPIIRVEGMCIKAEYKAPKRNLGCTEQLPEADEQRQSLSPEKVMEILKLISDDDCLLLGLNPRYARPEWMILQVLPIPPPSVRPSVVMSNSMRSEDDLTHQLAMIIRQNKDLRMKIQNGCAAHIINESVQILQFLVATYFNNELSGQPKSTQLSGRPIKSICCRLKSKEGRVRGNLMGKRVDFSARTVITPDPNINIDELGVPWSIALNLTFPETVTPYNIERLKQLVEYGAYPPPCKTGAKFIVRDDGRRFDLRYLRKSSDQHLEVGFKVERHLADGDYVVFNRQPSLHKMSIMGHRVKIMPYSTFRLNLSVTTPYNADFDGDEMNMHVPQSFETRAEVLELMMVPKCIVSPQSNRPVMGIVQDTLLGCFKISRRDTFIEKDVFMNILMWWEDFDGKIPTPAILKPKLMWTGKQVFSLIIPRQINLIRFSAWHSEVEIGFNTPGDTIVRIEKGHLLSGTLCKRTLGTSTGSLVHAIWAEVGPDAASKFLSHTQWLVNYWLLQNGFSIGIGDSIVDMATMEKITDIISKAKNGVKDLIQLSRDRQLGAEPGQSVLEAFENRVNQVLNKARDDAASSAQRSLSDSNNLKAMVAAGSKGSFINIAQMTACVGQQNVEGKRIPFGFTNRTLPHFLKDDYGPESRGFVENSYILGLTPQEFFFHAMGGREGLIDTAVKTSETGYIQRRLVKAMEDIMVKYDGTVRNSLGHVIQFLYGEDGMDAVSIESQKLESLKMKKTEFDSTFQYELHDDNWNPGYLLQQHATDLRDIPEIREVFDSEVQIIEADRYLLASEIAKNGENTWPMPVNLKRIVWNAQKTFKIDVNKPSLDLHPMEIVEAVDKLQARLRVVDGVDPISIEAQKNATLLFNILLRSTLASKRVLKEYGLTRDAFQWVIGEIETRFHQSMVSPGEMVGCVAAQSIGEPTTQMTLNTFHYAGVSAKNVTLGVPRLIEIINVAKNIKTPSLSVYLKPEVNKKKELAKNVQCALEYTSLQSVTRATELWYDPDPTDTVIEEDAELVKSFCEMPDDDIDLETVSPWLLRIELDREMMIDKKLSIINIVDKIKYEFGTDLTCIYSDDNADKLILRVRMVKHEKEVPREGDDFAQDELFLKQIESFMLAKMSLCGIPEISKVFIKSGKITKFNRKEGFITDVEWMLDTEGVNLLQVLCNEDVDASRTTSNHLIEVIEVLGIEAARRTLLHELREVISFDGSYVNYRHLAILCDLMTRKGYLMAITRHGINKNDTGPLMRCSFEETAMILLDAAAYAETDPVGGVSENIMLGQLAPVGTGACELYLNTEMLQQAMDTDLPSYTDGLGDAMKGTCSQLSEGTPYLSSPSYLLSPYESSPFGDARFSPYISGLTSSPFRTTNQYRPVPPSYSPITPPYSPFNSTPNSYNPISPVYNHVSPVYNPVSPVYNSASSVHGSMSPVHGFMAPRYAPASPVYDSPPPSYRPTSPMPYSASPYYSPTTPVYSPSSPVYSPYSLVYSPHDPSVPSYSPTSPLYSPTAPSYSPMSPQYTPSSRSYSPNSADSNPASQIYSPTSPHYSPTSPNYSLAHDTEYSPTSPRYSPTSPGYSLAHDTDYSPTSPGYSPTSPGYSPNVQN